MKEVWKGLIYQGIDYSKKLVVSDRGNIKNLLTKTKYKLQKNKNGYYVVVISLGSRNKKKSFKVHKAVAESFILNPNKYPEVNHIDGNKNNNNVSNLEWCTQSHNIKEAYKCNLIKKKSGTQIKNAKFSIKDIEYIINNYIPKDKKYGCRALAKRFKVSHSSISCIIKNKTYKKEYERIKTLT